MDILILLIDDTIIEYKNVFDLYFDKGIMYIKRILKDSYNCEYKKIDCYFISDVVGIEVLKVYDYCYV